MLMPFARALAFPAFAFLSIASASLPAQNPWDNADLATRRLPPAAFPALPALVRADLERRGCTVPQVWNGAAPGNVISGHFRSSATTDWAVLCSMNRVSTVLVYWAGRADSVAELGAAADKDFLQGVGDDRIGFSRAVTTADSAFIRRHSDAQGAPRPPLDHDGINDAFVEKGSTVWYWYQGRWLRLPGAD